ncbi:hypothetical protein TSAR_008960, partial [Trichomalopsis sarcophagae]
EYLIQQTLNNISEFANKSGFKFSKNKIQVIIFSKKNSIDHKLKLNISNDPVQTVKETLNNISELANKSGFKFSKNKTQAIIFSKKNNIDRKLKLNISNDPVQTVKEVKILGLIFDSRLTWKPHIEHLKRQCILRSNILKTLSARNWGASLQILVNTFKAIIQSKIDYGSIVYGTAKNYITKTLDPILNSCLRISSGAFRTSPINSLIVESNVLTLNLRREKLSTKYTQAIIFSKKNNIDHKLKLNISNDPVQTVKEVKILGLIFDSRLTWKPHIEHLKRQCILRSNILKTLSARNWGVIYGTAKNYITKTLDPILNSCLRISSGAFRTSPINSLIVESNVLPLNLRREKLSTKYILNNISEFANKSGFKFSKNKIQVIIFSKKNSIDHKLKLNISNDPVQTVKEVKILGLIFDSRLTWKPHIEHLKRQCIFRSNILKTLSARNWGASQQILYMEQLKIISLKPWTQFSTPAYEYLQEHLELAQ